MNRGKTLLRVTSSGLGLTCAAFFVFAYLVMAELRPKMMRFQAITAADAGRKWVNCFSAKLRLIEPASPSAEEAPLNRATASSGMSSWIGRD